MTKVKGKPGYIPVGQEPWLTERALTVPAEDTCYFLLITRAEAEALERREVPDTVQKQAEEMIKWTLVKE